MAEGVYWIEVMLTCSGELAETIAEALGRFVSNGVVIESETEFDEIEQENRPTGKIRVFGYLPFDKHIEKTRQDLEEVLWHLGQIQELPKPEYKPIYDQDWMTSWRKHYQPIQVGKQLLILPAWMETKPEYTRKIVRINPNLAFGTGTHPSTQLSLQALEELLQPGQNVIDIGCGSGILSIAALKLGAEHVLAVDVDNQAVRSTKQNAELNSILPNLETSKGSVREILNGDFSISQAPLVLVNILAPIIIRLFKDGLASVLKPGGNIVLAGILSPQVPVVEAAANEAGLGLVAQLEYEDWVALIMK